jgi:hypothetical protein
VFTGQRESRRIVIKRRRLPGCRCVALGTRLREPQGDVVGIGRPIEIRPMTVNAVRRERCILIACMATIARDSNMSTGQRESGATVRKRRGLPHARRMARLAGVAECPSNVIRVRRLCKIRRMALIAPGVSELVVAIDMACLARSCYVCAAQCKPRRAVIERRRLPYIRGMTCLANVTETCRHVIRIRRSRKIRRVAHVTVGICQSVVPIDVA